MLDVQALYEKLYKDLALIRQQESEEQTKNQRAIQLHKQQPDLKITELQKQLDSIRTFQESAAKLVPNSLLQRSFPPRDVDISVLDQLYSFAATSTANTMTTWERLYELASSGISYYSRAISQLRTESVSVPASTSNKYSDACRKVLTSPTAAELNQAFEIVKNTYTPEIIASKPYIAVQKESFPLFGRSTKPFPINNDCVGLAKQVFHEAFSAADQTLLMPCALPYVNLFQIRSDIVEEVLGAIRAYVISFLRFTTPATQKINFIDTCTFDVSCIGVLRPFLQGIIMPIPDSNDTCNNRLKELRELLYSEVVHHRRLLIYRFRKSTYDSQSNAHLQWLCSNAEKYNIQIIIVQELPRNTQDLEEQVPDWFSSNSLIIKFGSSKCLESSKTHSKIATYQEPLNLSDEFVKSILAAYAPTPLKTRFFDVHTELPQTITYTRDRRKPISLLYGIDKNGNKYANMSAAEIWNALFAMHAERNRKSPPDRA